MMCAFLVEVRTCTLRIRVNLNCEKSNGGAGNNGLLFSSGPSVRFIGFVSVVICIRKGNAVDMGNATRAGITS
jgi:hypothetical protein